MPKKKESEELKKYKEYVKERLTELTPVLQKASMGDFGLKIKIPEKEDEFSELFVGLSLMMHDLQALKEAQDKMEAEERLRIEGLEKWKKLTLGRELKMAELKKEIEKLKVELNKKI